jgi:hypothetical protein
VIEIAQENASAVYLGELQKFSQKGNSSKKQLSQAMFDQQLQRQFKYVNSDHDLDECEREVVRMMQLVRNLFYDSQDLLLPFAENMMEVSQIQGAKKAPKQS